MRPDRLLGTIDFHTAGIGMRLPTSGLGRLPVSERLLELSFRGRVAGATEVAGVPAAAPEVTGIACTTGTG